MTSGVKNAGVPTSQRGPIIFGLCTVLAFLAGFGYWAATAPLMGAAIAPGRVQVNGENQVIEHYEGGIVNAILVEEGDRVSAGDVLVKLDDTKANAERNRILKSLITAEAALNRARAERDDIQDVVYSPELLERAARNGLIDNLDQHAAEFGSRKARYLAELAVLDQRIVATYEEIDGLKAQKVAEQNKLKIITDELETKVALLKRGLIEAPKVATLRRHEADSLGRIGALAAAIAQRKIKVTETREQRLALSAERHEKASVKLNEQQSKIVDLREQLEDRQDTLERASIVTPVDGIIVKLHTNTIGNVIKPGDAIAEILPTSSRLVVEARIRPNDIDAVKVGQDARLRLTALNARTTPTVGARVAYVSADRLVDEASRDSYYVARLDMDNEMSAEIDRNDISPGMPVDVFISTDARTFVDYLIRPIEDSFARAFREE